MQIETEHHASIGLSIVSLFRCTAVCGCVRLEEKGLEHEDIAYVRRIAPAHLTNVCIYTHIHISINVFSVIHQRKCLNYSNGNVKRRRSPPRSSDSSPATAGCRRRCSCCFCFWQLQNVDMTTDYSRGSNGSATLAELMKR